MELEGKALGRKGSALCIGICSSIFLIAFVLPLCELGRLAIAALPTTSIYDFTPAIYSSLLLAAKGSIVIILAALFLAYAHRIIPGWLMQVVLKISCLGYAIPGAILGVTLITWSGTLNNSDFSFQLINYLFYGSSIGVVLAYLVRFLTVGLTPIEAGFKNIRISLDEAAKTLGKGRLLAFFKIHLPLLKYAISGGLLVLFIDILKEHPLTLIMNKETLATRTFSLFAMEERYTSGAIPALILVFSGVMGILIIRICFKNLKN
jgi:iron(III) transport system permease protein